LSFDTVLEANPMGFEPEVKPMEAEDDPFAEIMGENGA
jgi:hypothetical protein